MAITKLEITSRRPVANGVAFGDVGPYEQLVGTASFAVDPQHPLNCDITDIALAPRGADGLVQFSADFFLLRPVRPESGNRRLLLGVANRGRKAALRFNSPPAEPEPEQGPYLGNGFLMRHGYTVAECGWEWGVPPGPGQMTIGLPEAVGRDGPFTGKVMLEWQPNQPTRYLPFSEGLNAGSRPYSARDLHDPEASLTVRDHQMAPRQTILRSLWQFARLENGQVVTDATHVYLSRGFEPGKVYELVYYAINAPVIGLGMLAMRDIASFLKYGSTEQGNPCAGTVEYAYTFGASQTGRFLRHFLYLGLNEDEEERVVFDGVIAHIAAHRRGQFNQRFGIPSSRTLFNTDNLFPFTDVDQTDPLTGQSDGLLRRLTERGKVPKLFHINSSSEYWDGAASLIHTNLDGTQDIALPSSARIYLMAGTQHVSGTLPLTDTGPQGAALAARSRHPLNSVDYSPLLRAALVNLDHWVSSSEEPPPSKYPRLADGSAVPPASLEKTFSAIPGVPFPKHLPQVPRLDFGQGWPQGIPTMLPPAIGTPYPTFVSAVDENANEVGGIPLPDLTVPLATYTGWNLRHPDVGGEDQPMMLRGATLPFPRTAAERQTSGDPRRSIEERYRSKEEYLARVRQAAQTLVEAKYLLAEDIEGVVERSALRYDLFTARATEREDTPQIAPRT